MASFSSAALVGAPNWPKEGVCPSTPLLTLPNTVLAASGPLKNLDGDAGPSKPPPGLLADPPNTLDTEVPAAGRRGKSAAVSPFLGDTELPAPTFFLVPPNRVGGTVVALVTAFPKMLEDEAAVTSLAGELRVEVTPGDGPRALVLKSAVWALAGACGANVREVKGVADRDVVLPTPKIPAVGVVVAVDEEGRVTPAPSPAPCGREKRVPGAVKVDVEARRKGLGGGCSFSLFLLAILSSGMVPEKTKREGSQRLLVRECSCLGCNLLLCSYSAM